MFKSMDKWLMPYLRSVVHRPRNVRGPFHIMLAMCDHFEPLSPGGKQPHTIGLDRVRRWANDYPKLCQDFRDADGKPPQHTFFFPQEEYHPDFLGPLADLTGKGFGEVDIHLHHRNDTKDTLRDKLTDFRDTLRREHGLLGDEIVQPDSVGQPGTKNQEPQTPRYAFIHGNWALCNSRPDGDWCGVNEELSVLRETGCYADFTFPSVPSPTQPRMVNCIYYAHDKPNQPRGHERGVEATVIQGPGCGPHPSALSPQPSAFSPHPSSLRPPPLLLVTGPLALNWKWRKWGILPRIEHADITGKNPATAQRAHLWIRQHIHVRGKPDWIFIKLHTHGCNPGNTDALLGDPMRRLHLYLQSKFNDGTHYVLHYVTARELVNLVHAAERGQVGSPNEWRDLGIRPPPVKSSPSSRN